MKKMTYLLGVILLLISSSLWSQELTIKQRMLMPGEVIQGHANIEAECEKCHGSFEKDDLPKLCIGCHKEIASDRKTQTGFHGQGPLSSQKLCNVCHTDHLGRDGDIIGIQKDAFDHSWTRFPLKGKHALAACDSCHEPNKKFKEAETVCVSCHKKNDFHDGALGDKCESCHKPEGWQNRDTFDHSKTDFQLKGAHKTAACSGCHANQVYEFEQVTCVGCHKAADPHAGKNGEKCDKCHTEETWEKRIFDHNTTKFPLRFRHDQIPCLACHKNGVVEEGIATTCASCHVNDDRHLGRNGDQCQNCHKPEGWDKISFDHDRTAGFPLLGHHKELACTQCHSSALQDEIPRDCGSCHAADDPHKSDEMQVCGTCHNPTGWKTVSQFDHQLTHFPLVGMHQVTACQNCHIKNQFAGTDSQCVTCHKADDHHKGALGQQCQSCHTPNAWKLWQFDHDKLTDFALDGAHQGLACESCHKPDTKPEDISKVCGTCHAQQDIHNGGFGKDCSRCHSKNKFFELILQDMNR